MKKYLLPNDVNWYRANFHCHTVCSDGAYTPEKVKEETLGLLTKCSKYPNFVLSSGCDIPPMTPWTNIDAFFAASDEFYGK